MIEIFSDGSAAWVNVRGTLVCFVQLIQQWYPPVDEFGYPLTLVSCHFLESCLMTAPGDVFKHGGVPFVAFEDIFANGCRVPLFLDVLLDFPNNKPVAV